MQRIKKMVKSVSAISAGALLFGATMAGALAAGDLAKYPAPFVDANAKAYSYLMAVGNTGIADAADSIASIDIGRGLDKVEVASGGGTISVAGGSTEDVPLGSGIANSSTIGFDNALEDDDIPTLFDGEVTFKSSSYDVRELLLLSDVQPSVQTSLTSADDDYESSVLMETATRDSIKYIYAFDESINIANATSTDALKINFLGKTLKITDADDAATKFTAQVGDQFFMKVGEVATVDVDGTKKSVTLQNVGSGGAIVIDVDGTQETISSSQTETVNGVEITNDETFYDSNDVAQRSATLIMGKQATETFKDGDPYPGTGGTCSNEDPDDLDCWVWDIDGMRTTGTSTVSSGWNGNTSISGTYIAIENDFVINDDSDDPQAKGECINLPNNYLSICLDSLTVADTDYATYTFDFEASADLSQAGGAYANLTSEPAIHIYTSVDDGLELTGSALAANNVTTNKKFKDAYLHINRSNTTVMEVFYKDKDDNKIKYAGFDISPAADARPLQELLRVRYKDTKDTNVVISWDNITNVAAGNVNITLDIDGDSTNELTDQASDIVMEWGLASNHFDSLGATRNSEEGTELIWNTSKGGFTLTNIGSKDEDHREPYGIIIRDPKSHSSSDQVVVEIPGDQVQANIVIKGSASTVSGAGGTIISQVATAPKVVTANEVASTAGKNLILVGGPCVNELTAKFLGLTFPACGAGSGLSAGEAIIKLVDNGDKVAMIVAGWSADDTRRAAAALENYKAYAGKLKGTEVKVTGTGLTVTSVEPVV